MQTLETLKRSITSADDLAGVVRTMKTMAAVSIRQYETASESLEVYSQTIETGLRMLIDQARKSGHSRDTGKALTNRSLDLVDSSGSSNGKAETIGGIVFGSDQGMCGQFNEQMAHYAATSLTRNQGQAVTQSVPVLCVGHRVADNLRSAGVSVSQVYRLPGSATGITSLVQDLLPAIDSWRLSHGIDRILVFHNQRLTASSWRPQAVQLLPLRPESLKRPTMADSGTTSRSLPMWSMDTATLFSRLVKQFLFVTLFRACAESLAGENASRIAAMQAAERNIKERLQLLRSEYATQRQTKITEELLDVVTGFEALKQPTN